MTVTDLQTAQASTAGRFIAEDLTERTGVANDAGEVMAYNRVFLGAAGSPGGQGPQAFMVEAPPGRVSPAHFHNVDQFQLFFPAAGATYKNVPVDSPLLHYTDAHTAYGPFAAGPGEPLRWMTLRARHSSLIALVPQERDLLPRARRARRHILASAGDLTPLEPGQASTTALIEPHDDGLASYLLEAGPHTTVPLPAAARPAGQYCCLLDGGVVAEDGLCQGFALRWDDSSDSLTSVTAAAAGLRLVVLRFPDPPTTDRDHEHAAS